MVWEVWRSCKGIVTNSGSHEVIPIIGCVEDMRQGIGKSKKSEKSASGRDEGRARDISEARIHEGLAHGRSLWSPKRKV
jgi:hypothetical protein